MNYLKIIISGVLFTAMCAPIGTGAAAREKSGIPTQQTYGEVDGSQPSGDLREKEQAQKLLRDQEIQGVISQNQLMEEKIEKNDAQKQENQDQDTEILQELLLEFPVSEAPSVPR
ncbi:MAG: hypothetical protein HIU83_08455 [Proteobacteria bacterium]|nr:hypothetical protein [Pseudomonadota bacterium]